MVELFANSEDPDQTPRSAASDLGLHCLPITLSGISTLQWVKYINFQIIRRKTEIFYDTNLITFCGSNTFSIGIKT